MNDHILQNSIKIIRNLMENEELISEAPRIPKKPGQPDKSDKHSDLYTDEDPKGTIHGLGFKDVATAKESVSKIKNSGRSHAHKIQAAIAMEQRAKVSGKTSEAAVYRKFINSMKEKTKEMNEEGMVVGTGGFTGSADPKGPVAGFDPVMDGRSKVMRRLPPPYRKSLTSKKKGK